MSTTYSRVKIAGTSLDTETHLDLTIEVGRTASGRRTLTVRGSGWWPPGLDSVDWSAPVAVVVPDRRNGTEPIPDLSLSVRSDGPTWSDDLQQRASTWTLTGIEAPPEPAALAVGAVTVAAAAYQDGLTVTIGQDDSGRKSLSLSATGRVDPGISGVDYSEPVTVAWTAPDGTDRSVAVRSPGPQITDDAEGERVSWTLSGVEEVASGTLALEIGSVTVDAAAYQDAIQVSTRRGADGRLSVTVSATGRADPGLGAIDWTGDVEIDWGDDSVSVRSDGPEIATDYTSGRITWSVAGTEAQAATVGLSVGAVTVPAGAYQDGLTVDVSPPSREGAQTLRLRAAGIVGPGLGAVDWSAAVTVSWTGPAGAGSLAILTPGPQLQEDVGAGTLTWSLDGQSAPTGHELIGIGAGTYWGTAEVSLLGGGQRLQRASNGDGTLLTAWTKRAIRLRGQAVAPPTLSAGVVAITSRDYSDDILVTGYSTAYDVETGLTAWSLEGEEP